MLNDNKDFRTVRVTFSKADRARYISHLDLNRTMIRALRRAQLPVWYTEGFNRHPYVTFACPLSLGYEGKRETMDIRLIEEMDMQELVNRLDAVMPQGLHILDAAEAVNKVGRIDTAAYRITVACSVETVRELLNQPEIVVLKRTKSKQMKPVDLKPALEQSGMTVTEENGQAVISLRLPCNSTQSFNPSLLIGALRDKTESPALSASVCRLAVYDANGDIFC